MGKTSEHITNMLGRAEMTPNMLSKATGIPRERIMAILRGTAEPSETELALITKACLGTKADAPARPTMH
jgi:hypothetical protein